MEKIGENYQSTLNYIKQKLDMSVHDFKTRNDIVQDILAKCPYIQEYWDKKTNVHNNSKKLVAISQYGMLTSRLTNYLLMSDESKKMSRQEKSTYVFTDEYMKKKINRESITISNEGKSLNILNSPNLNILQKSNRNSRNFIIESSVKINKKDLERSDYLANVLKDYQAMIDSCIKKRIDGSYNRRILNWNLHTLRDDQKLAKTIIKGYFGENLEKYPQPQKKCDFFDWRDSRTLLKLLQMKGDFYENYNFWLTCFDLQCLLDKLDLTEQEDIVRKMLYTGLKFKDIEYYTGYSYSQIYYNIVPNIIGKIQNENIPYDVEVNPNILAKIENRDAKEQNKKNTKEKIA